MSGTFPPSTKCYCGAFDHYGGKINHFTGCKNKGANFDIQCQCGHWGGHHYTLHGSGYCNGCSIIGCKCENGAEEFVNVQSKASKACECGARATGIPDGSVLHSDFGHRDPRKWCPQKAGYQAS